MAKLSASYNKSMSLNPFSVTDLRREVKSVHPLRMRMFEIDSIGHSEFD